MASVVLRPTTRALFSLHRLLPCAPPFPTARRLLLLLPASHFRRPSPDRRASPARGRLGAVRAAQVNESGAIDSNMIESMEKKIKDQLIADKVTVQDAYGDGRHVSIDVISSAFEGQSAVNRQRMVYKAIWEELQTTVHAVDQMTTRTPAEATGEQ